MSVFRRLGLGWPVACVAAAAVFGGLAMAVVMHDPVTPAVVEEAYFAPVHQVLYDEWNERITRDTTWRSRGSSSAGAGNSRGQRNPPSQVLGPQPPPNWFIQPPAANMWAIDPRAAGKSGGNNGSSAQRAISSGYRTVCVRLCDGSFFPISHGSHEGNFNRDQATCTNSCPGARLYYYRPGSEDADDMVDMSGQPYSKLQNANLFRTQYVESCKCKPHPWEQAAVDRHRIYALEDQQRKGNRTVVAELESLKSKSRVDKPAKANRRRPADRRSPANE